MKRHLVLAALLSLPGSLSAGAANAGVAAGEEWNQWGGPNRNFVVPSSTALSAWAEDGPLVLWERELGSGYSGIVSQGRRLFTMTRHGETEVVVALDRDSGATLWEYVYTAPADASHRLDTTWGAGPNSTPLVVDGRVYTLGFTGKLHSLDAATGSLMWAHDLAVSVDDAVPYFGLSTSPLRYRNLLIVVAGGAHAFDLESGEPRWTNLEFEGSYASPVLFESGGRVQAIVPVAGEVVSLDPGSGQLLWRHEHANQHRTFLSGPVLGEDDTIFASAYFLGSLGLKLETDGNGVTELWENDRLQLSQTNAIRDGNVIYGFHNSFLKALDVTTGDILWRHRGYERANLVRSGDRYLLFDRYGGLSLVSLDREGPTTHAKTQILEGRSWTPPTLIGSHLYVRNLEKVIALDLSRSREAKSVRSAEIDRPGTVEASPDFLAAKRRLMRAYLRGDDKGLIAARAEFGRWLEDDALGHLAHYYTGLAAFQQVFVAEDHAAVALLRESEEHLKSALVLAPRFADAHALLARVYPTYYRLDPQRAAVAGPLGDEHLATALRFAPDNPRVLAIQGLDFLYSPPQYGGDKGRGVTLLSRALERFAELPEGPPGAEPDWGPAIVRAWYGRALLSTAEGDRARVIDTLRQALVIEPEFASAQRLLESAVKVE